MKQQEGKERAKSIQCVATVYVKDTRTEVIRLEYKMVEKRENCQLCEHNDKHTHRLREVC